MIKIYIENTPFQTLKVPFESDYIELRLYFKNRSWYMSMSYKDKKLNGLKLSSRVLLLKGLNLPFELLVDDSELNLDPYELNSFESNFKLYLLQRDELIQIRGFEVG